MKMGHVDMKTTYLPAYISLCIYLLAPTGDEAKLMKWPDGPLSPTVTSNWSDKVEIIMKFAQNVKRFGNLMD